MNFHKKIKSFFKERGISNKEITKCTGISETMVGRYLNKNKPNYEFIIKIAEAYPEIDFNYLFKNNVNEINMVSENEVSYNSPQKIIDEIEGKLNVLKETLTQKSHN